MSSSAELRWAQPEPQEPGHMRCASQVGADWLGGAQNQSSGSLLQMAYEDAQEGPEVVQKAAVQEV